MKRVTILLITALFSIGCAKDGPVGPEGKQGSSGPEAQSFSINMTFDQFDNYGSSAVLMGLYKPGDAVMIYMYYDKYATTDYWVQLPIPIGDKYYFFELGDNGHIFINTEDSPVSTWLTPVTLSFRVVLIKGGLSTAVDYAVYNDVVNHYSLNSNY